MNKTIEHIPKAKQDELSRITTLISAHKKVEMLILFGSYASGKWVEDSYIENSTLYEYRSDYDLLVVLRHEDFQIKYQIEDEVKSKLIDTTLVTTPVNLIFHGIKQLNNALTEGNYFFRDIKNEGIVLYDTEKHKLANPKKLTPKQAQEKAQGYFDQWFESASRFIEHYNYDISKLYWNDAAFHLHQAVERYYTTILLVFTDYRPKDHNLDTLGVKAGMCDKRFDIFPKNTGEEKRLFELLKKAYIDARYKMSEYHITKEDLEYLAEKAERLKELTLEICREKIKQIGATGQ